MDDEADPIMEAVIALRAAGVAVAPISDELDQLTLPSSGAPVRDFRAVRYGWFPAGLLSGSNRWKRTSVPCPLTTHCSPKEGPLPVSVAD